jgi:hypothetical protein
MKYTIAAHPTWYRGVEFRSRLEARWAAFFDLAGWKWEYEPFDLPGWNPDFRVIFPCYHSQCGESHSLLVEVKPYMTIEQFAGHPALDYPFGENSKGEAIYADASAAFGLNPDITYWVMIHGHGGGEYTVSHWVDGVRQLWNEAGRRVRYRPRR